jgi:dCTP deaminase
MTVLNDISIKKRCERVPTPMIAPYNSDQVQPASYDVRLGCSFRIFQRDHREYVDLADPIDITKEVILGPGEYLTLHPGEFVLGVTDEKVHMPDDIVARIEGKSSIGRLGLMAHVTAGYIDPGFRGNITLEMACFHPLAIRLRPDMLIAQLSFHEMIGPAGKPYRGRYQDADGVEPSKYGEDIPGDKD